MVLIIQNTLEIVNLIKNFFLIFISKQTNLFSTFLLKCHWPIWESNLKINSPASRSYSPLATGRVLMKRLPGEWVNGHKERTVLSDPFTITSFLINFFEGTNALCWFFTPSLVYSVILHPINISHIYLGWGDFICWINKHFLIVFCTFISVQCECIL